MIKLKTSVLTSVLLLTVAGCTATSSAGPQAPVAGSGGSRITLVPSAPTEVHSRPTDGPLDLGQCIEIALKNNPQVIGAGWDISEAKAEKKIASAAKWPTIGFESGYRHYLDDQRLVMPRRANEPGVYGNDIFSNDIVLRMPIFTAGRITNEIKAVDLLSQSARHRLARTRRELVFNISQVFYNILAQRHIIESLDFSKKALEEHEKRVNDLMSVQKAAKVDLLRTEVRLADINQRLVSEKNVMSILHRVLVNFIGLSKPQSEVQIKGDLQLPAVGANLSDSIAKAYVQRADYLSAEKQVAAQSKRLDVARAGHWPIVSAQASYGLRSTADSTSHPAGADTTEDVGFVGFVLEAPIFEGGAIAARTRSARAKLRSMQEQLRKLKLQIDLDVETAILNTNSSHERVVATEKSIEQAKESLRIEREKYELGKGSITDVLDAQSALLDAQTIYYHALSDYNSAIAQLHLAVGDEK